MRKSFLLIAVLLMLFEFTATAQIPRTLQIGVTNGTATVSSQNSPGTFFGELETTTNLSPPVAWSGTPLNFLVSGVSSNFPVANSQEFFRFLQTYPIFEFAIFYNVNMEIAPGQPMVVKGPVFCNASIWAYAPYLTFLSSVDAVGFINTNTTDPFSDNYTNTGSPTFDVPFLTNQSSLTMPITGTNTSAASVQNILNLPPSGLAAPNPAAYQYPNQSYIFNEADLIISNSATGINGNSAYGRNITIYYENQYNIPYLSLVTNDIVQRVTNGVTVTTNLFYSFVTNVTSYDYRESKTVQAVQIDVAKFNKWLTNAASSGGHAWNNKNLIGSTSKGHAIDSIYVLNRVPLTLSQLPAVRIINGQQLPSLFGLTVATPQPLYVLGNYNVQTNGGSPVLGTTNTASTYPAALMGDAITILSGNWLDSYAASTPLSSRIAVNTTVNAAILTGIVPTDPTISGNYSGGVENFLRLLENWSNGLSTLTYNGSIVVMFSSQYATNYWGSANVYGVPRRNWSFDQNFTDANKLPPLTPSVVNYVTP